MEILEIARKKRKKGVLKLPRSKDKNNWFWGGLDTSKNPEIIEMRVLGFSHEQIEKLLTQNGAE